MSNALQIWQVEHDTGERRQFPFVYRFQAPYAVGVKTFLGHKQFGSVCSLPKKISDATKDQLLEEMATELIQKVNSL